MAAVTDAGCALELDDAGVVLVGTLDDPALVDALRARLDDVTAALRAAQEPRRFPLEPLTVLEPPGPLCDRCGRPIASTLDQHRRGLDPASQADRVAAAARASRPGSRGLRW